MTSERVKELSDLVMQCNKKLENGISASLEVARYHIDIYVFYNGDKTPEPGITMYSYTSPTYVIDSAVEDGIRTMYDPELKRGEEHLRRLLDDVDR